MVICGAPSNPVQWQRLREVLGMILRRGIGAFRGLGGTVQDLAAAIARQEGANPAYNNPGNLRAGPGQVGTSPNGIAIFPDAATGEAALERQVQLNINRGLTLEEFFAGKPGVYAGYAPAADSNQPNVYAAHVSQWTGLPTDVPLNTLDAGGASGAWDAGESAVPDMTAEDSSGWIWAGVAAGVGVLVLILASD